MAETEIVFTDRYQAAGIPYPDPETMCKGGCEGMGCFPAKADDPDETVRALWHAAGDQTDFREKGERAEKGLPLESEWRFVTCRSCYGTGKRPVPSPEGGSK